MNKIIKRIVSAVTAVAVTLTAVFVFGVPEMIASAAAASGNGWSIDRSGKFTIENDTGMQDWLKNGLCGTYAGSVRSIEIKNRVTTILESAFAYCKCSKPITIPDSVTSIYAYAFKGSQSPSPLIIPSSVKTIQAHGTISTSVFKDADIPTIMIMGDKISIDKMAFGDYEYAIIYPRSLNVSNLVISATQAKYERNGDKFKITEINYGNKKRKVTISDDMNINFVAESERAKVSQWGHTHLGGTATCEARAKCDICDLEYSALAAHTWNDGEVTIPATCTEKGVKTFTCSTCRATQTEDIDVLEHSFSSTWSSDENQHWHKCANCTATDTKQNHSWGSGTVTKPATCTKTGIRTYTCSCGKTKTETISTIAHTIVTDAAVAPTCTAAGKTAGSHCSVCNTVIAAQTTVPAKGHTWGAWTVKTPATETDKGEETRECSVCHTAESREISVLAHVHSLTKRNRVEPDCMTAGNIEYWTCSGCRKSFSDENGTTEVTDTALPAKGHTIVTDAAVEATCTDTGLTEGSHCSACGIVIKAQETIPTKSHTWGDWMEKTPATETSKGEETRECSVCHTVESREIPVLNHKHTLVHIPETPATETTEGVKAHWHCDGCGKDFWDEGGTQEATADDLRIGKIETEIQAPENVPTPEIATSKEELIEAALTDDEQKKVEQGKDIKIILKVEDATEKVTDSDKTAVTSEFSKMTNYKLGQYLDVTLLKKIGEEQEQKITETTAPIKVTFEIPAALRGKPEYSVIRVHNGTATVLSDLDSDPNTVTLETDKFSTYALTYKEKSSSSGSSGNSGSSGGDSHRPTYPDTSDTSDNTSSGTSENTSSDNSNNTSNDNSNNTSSETSGNTSSDNSGNTSSDNSGSMSSDNSDSASSDNSGSMSSDNSDSASSDTSGNTSSDNSDSASSETSGNTSSGNSGNSSDATASNNEIRLIQSENNPPDNSGNPSTGIVVSLIPLATAAAVLTIVSKRKKK